MAKQLMPPAQLEERPSDVPFNDELLAKLSLFAQLKRKLTLDKYPGTLKIRRFHAGDVIVRQGDAGWTAFYILNLADVFEIRKSQLQSAPDGPAKKAMEAKMAQVGAALAQSKDKPADDVSKVASVHLTVARTAKSRRRGLGLLQRLFRDGDAAAVDPTSIVIDGNTEVDYGTMQAFIGEGELFGERSCLSGAPRSASIVARRDCFMIEMLRNILDQLQKDPAYKAYTDEVNKKRIIELHLRKLSILGDLNDEQFTAIQDKLQLISIDPGKTIYDEYEPADSVYLVRSGLVKQVKKVSALLHPENIRNFPNLIAALREGEAQADSLRGKVWQLLPDAAKTLCRNIGEAKSVPHEIQWEIVHGLNQLVKNPQLPEMKELQKAALSAPMQKKIEGLPDKRKEWSDQQLRRYNRHLLEVIFEPSIRERRRRVGPDCVLFYCNRGEFIGESAALEHNIRDHSCIASGQPQEGGKARELGQVELVKIPRDVVRNLFDECLPMRLRIERKAAERRKQTQKQLSIPPWDDTRNVTLSRQFEEMGLIQGQRLMIIDLDRCTRCDECVQACVNSHDDGNSRLFLDGPRFGKYLVPTSCRSCLDPVCMIGCPVGSIHRGGNGQIVIEDWCIGCGLCAGQCPYGSIQMHDIGVIPEVARGWRFLPAGAVGNAKWTAARFKDAHWEEAAAPLVNDWEFRTRLNKHIKRAPLPAPPSSTLAASMEIFFKSPELMSTQLGQAICLRYAFDLPKELVKDDSQFKMELTSLGKSATVWLNGVEIQAADKPKGGKREFYFPPRPPAPAKAGAEPATPPVPQTKTIAPLRAGRNVLAVQVEPEVAPGKEILKVRMDAVQKPTLAEEVAEEVTQKMVSERAVVCDLCSDSFKQVPACVNACPHDAAMRVDARFEFPVH
jgi:Fe-S-cluster-containing hydrogenase component 2/CRP-like cAMP-binding protein